MTTASPVTLPISSGRYALDNDHSGVFFQIRHLGLSNVRGLFHTFDATLVVGDSLDEVEVSATIDLASVDTNQADRDAHLLGTDFFRADEHPTMSFRSTGVRAAPVGSPGDDRYLLDGVLTVNGVTKPVTFDVDFNGTDRHPVDGRVHVGFGATAEIRRSDFGIDFNVPVGLGKVAIGDKVKVDIDAQFLAP
jgi:polyisoprenoid-binding protein YceI